MTYRDDHDAALLRADALERELAAAQKRAASDQSRIATLEAQLAATRAAVRSFTPPAPRPARPYAAARAGGGIIAAALLIGVFAAGTGRHTPAWTPPPHFDPVIQPPLPTVPPSTFDDPEVQRAIREAQQLEAHPEVEPPLDLHPPAATPPAHPRHHHHPRK